MQRNKQYQMKVLLSSFHLNGHTLGFHPQTLKLESHLLIALVLVCPLLGSDQCTVVVLYRIQDTGVRQIVEGPSGSKVKELNLTNCVRVSDVTLLRIAQR